MSNDKPVKELKRYDFKPDPNYRADQAIHDDVRAVMSGAKSLKDLEREADAVLNAGVEVRTIRDANKALETLPADGKLIVDVPVSYIEECQLWTLRHLVDFGMGTKQVSVGRAYDPHTQQEIPGICTIYHGLIQSYRMTTNCLTPFMSEMLPQELGRVTAEIFIQELAKVGIRG